MRNLSCIIFIFFHFFLIGQGGWKKTYHLQNSSNSQLWDVFQTPSQNFIMTGLTYETTNNDESYKLTIVGTDAIGNTLWSKKYGSSKFTYLDGFGPNSTIHDDTFFYVTTCVRDSNNKYVGVLLKLNFSGDTLWQKVYRNPDPKEDVIPYAVSKSVDGGFLLTGFFQHWVNNTNLCLLIKTDNNGNELWRKKISKSVPNVQAGYGIVQDTFTKRIIIIGYQYIGNANSFGTHSNILILDSLGAKLKQTTFNNYDGGPFGAVIQLKDKNFLTCGTMNANSDLGIWPRLRNLAVKFDINGGVIWSKEYDTLSRFTMINQVFEQPDKSIIMSGYLDTLLNYNIAGPVKIRLYKTDKDGNLKWKKYIGSAYTYTSSEYTRSLHPTSDGGFILSAWMVNAPMAFKPPYSIIKVDSTGCDTSEQWCRSVALNISKFQSTTGWELELFPNPVSDFLRLSINAPGKKFQIKISDVSGKEVGNYHYETSAPVLIDTRRYQEGVYSATLFYEGKAVETKKLVIVR